MTTAPPRAVSGVIVNPVDAYAHDVVNGRLPAGKYHKLACARHLSDRARENTPWFPYRFQWAHAERFLKFSRLMKHYKGRQFAGKHFEPTPNQVFRLGSVFGWRQVQTGYRRFTTAYHELPRKNGKSFEAALVALYVTFFEGEPGAEGYCLATKEKQARITFDAAKRMVKDSGLAGRIGIQAKNLHNVAREQKLEPLGSDSDTTDGLNPHSINVDELHAWKTRGLLDVVESATGARVNPLNNQITTAGDDLVSVCGDQHTYACQILDGVLEDDPSTVAFFAFVAHADEDDDPWAEATWQKANPNWGISVDPDDMRKLAAKAQKIPSAAAEFKQKRLNLWVNATAPCLSLEGWRKGQTGIEDLSREAFALALEHQPCYVGIDLASKIDLCSLSLFFPPHKERLKTCVIQYIWTPKDTLLDRAHSDRAPYPVWVDQGWLLTTPGTQVDHQVIRGVLAGVRTRFDIQLIGFDPWHADTLAMQLVKEDGFDEQQVLVVPQTYQGMSSAESWFKAEVLAGTIDVNGCPVTAWAVSNTVEQTDGKGNIFFTKKKSRGRIDPVKSITIGAANWRKDATEDPVYQVFVFGGRK